ncbi:MAG: NifU family protein [Cyclobacteriaceae bacterium]|nr:MAG: NifU family protein [Cyclobacteriaceae bacterium]
MKQKKLLQRIEESLSSIRPYLEADGGDVRVLRITDDNILQLEFLGACSSCPMSSMTFRAGVEEAIKKAAPEIKAIEVVNLTL